MNYPLISVAQIVGRVIRRTGLKDSSLIIDINEWVAEAMEILQVTLSLESVFEENVKISFHKAKFPCGMAELWAVEYCGTRLRMNNSVRDPRVAWYPQQTVPNVLDAVFVSGVTKENTPSGNYLFNSTFQKVQDLPWHATSWYKLDGRHILTSFEEGYITLFFGKVPTDRDGFLMIPNEGNFKEALTWFLQARLAGRGYPNPELSMEQMDAKFELFAGRGIEKITYPSVDKMQATTDTLTRLLPDLDYYESMFTGTGPETSYGI
jgi:hypothetical protein